MKNLGDIRLKNLIRKLLSIRKYLNYFSDPFEFVTDFNRTHLPGCSRGWWVGRFLLLTDLILLPPDLIAGLTALRGADGPTAAPFNHMGARVATRRRAQSLARVLGRRTERPTCGRRQEQVSTITMSLLVLVIAHRRKVSEFSAASYRSTHAADHWLANTAARRAETRLTERGPAGPVSGGAQGRPDFP